MVKNLKSRQIQLFSRNHFFSIFPGCVQYLCSILWRTAGVRMFLHWFLHSFFFFLLSFPMHNQICSKVFQVFQDTWGPTDPDTGSDLSVPGERRGHRVCVLTGEDKPMYIFNHFPTNSNHCRHTPAAFIQKNHRNMQTWTLIFQLLSPMLAGLYWLQSTLVRRVQ